MSAATAVDLVEIYRRLQQVEKSDNALRTAMAHTNLTPELRHSLAGLLRGAKHHETMVAVLDEWAQAVPAGTPSDALLESVSMYVEAEEPAKAHGMMVRYLEQEPDDWRAWIDLAVLRLQTADTNGAARALEKAEQHGRDEAVSIVRRDKRFEAIRSRPTDSGAVLELYRIHVDHHLDD